MVYAVIMAGGMGTRFWPKSRRQSPKQFLVTVGKQTMLQATVKRIGNLVPGSHIIVVTTKEYGSVVAKQVRSIPPAHIWLEPERRDTAATIGYSAMKLQRLDPEAVMVVLPADHHVDDAIAFRSNLTTAINLARSQDCLVTIGIRPNGPVAAYGYIELGPEVSEWRFPFYEVTRFTEKPDPATAQAFVDSGRYFWNAGIFVWKAKTILQALERFMPGNFTRLQTIAAALGTDKDDEVLAREYALMEKKSIDYGVLERAQNIFMVPASFGWDDVGSWQALGRVHPRDHLGNVAIGPVVSVDTRDCIIDGGGKLVATLGISDLVIVDTDDALLVCHKSRDQEIKRLLDHIERSGWGASL